MTEDFPYPWYRIVDENLRATLEAELRKQLGPVHRLVDVPLKIVAKRDDRDDVLALLDDGRVAEIHLTWSGRPEANPRWPTNVVYKSMTDWISASGCS